MTARDRPLPEDTSQLDESSRALDTDEVVDRYEHAADIEPSHDESDRGGPQPDAAGTSGPQQPDQSG